MRPRACLALALVFACGNPDNTVVGGVQSNDPAFPSAFIPKVASAIHYTGTVTNVNPAATPPTLKVQRSIVILSGQDHLCDALAAHADYFQTPPQGFVDLVLMTKPGVDGTFFFSSSSNDVDVSLLAAFQGGKVALYGGGAGSVGVQQFDLGGNAKGSFDVVVGDAANVGHEVFGRFKTEPCPAIASAYIPRFF